MRKMAKWGAMGAAATVVLLAGGIGVMAQDKLALVTARQDFMKGQGADAKAISDFSKGTGDKDAALKAVNDLIARAPKIVDMFPAGTSATDFPDKSAAKPELWTDWDKVKMIPAALLSEEEKVKAAIESGNQQAVTDALGSMNKNGCGACHGNYRVKKT
jgi:cytochrome c556